MIPKYLVILLSILQILSLTVYATITPHSADPMGNTLYVGGSGTGNYTLIQDALDNASDGDTIYVYNDSSPYQENILITQSILLQGENKETTIIDGNNQGNTITIEHDAVIVSGFTISNGSGHLGILEWYITGIRITANHVCIKNNIIANNRLGIFIKNAEHLTLTNNTLLNDCVVIAPYDLATVYTPFIEQYYIHTIENNTVNGKPLIYRYGLTNTLLPSEAGQIILVSSYNNTIKDTSFNQADFAIILINSSYNTISNNILTNGSAGLLWLLYSSNNHLKNNTISQNLEGICLDQASTQNTITYNILNNNSHCNLMIESKSHHNHVQNNDFLGTPRVHGYLLNTFRTTYHQNYWDDHDSILPKIIRGELTFSFLPALRFPWFGIDWQPSAQQNV